MIYKPHGYQQSAKQKILDTDRVGLFFDMGLGKTVITLTAINELINEEFAVSRVLVIAPLKVAEDTWSKECYKWEHLKGLRISKILGTPTQRRKALALDADIYIINRENVKWLVDELSSIGNGWFFDMVVIDELSSFKSPKAQRFKALKTVITGSKRVVGLTGTPAPNGLIDLWAQVYLLDGGERLGRTITGFRERYFSPGQRNATTIFNYIPKAEAEGAILSKIDDICVSMKAEDWLDMPERIDNIREVVLNEKQMKQYEDFERTCYLEFMDGEITATSRAALTNKLLQFAGGAMYKEDKQYCIMHDEKLKALEEIIEAAQGQPVLCFYNYKHELERIQEKFKNAVKLETTEDIDKWNNGDIELLITHPASSGYGLNLQAGGHIIVWYGLTWSLELYQQANARLYRQGQNQSVIIHHLITKGTADERVVSALHGKEDVQEGLIQGLKMKYGDLKSNRGS